MALEALAKEGISVRDKRVRLGLEEEALRRRLEAEAVRECPLVSLQPFILETGADRATSSLPAEIARLQALQTMIAEISEISKAESSVQASGSVNPRLEAFDPVVDRLVFEFGNEFEALGLDEVVVGAIAPAVSLPTLRSRPRVDCVTLTDPPGVLLAQVKRLLVDWRPLEEDGILPVLWKWRKAFRLAAASNDEGSVDVYGRPSSRERQAEKDREMTPYESLIWNVWLPRVRSAIK